MTKLDKLIKELCPNGVEYKTLGEVAKVTSGSSAPQNSSDFSENGFPFCRTSDVGRAHLSVDFNDILDKITENAGRKMTLMPKGTILIPKSGASTLLNHKVRLSIDSYVVSHLAAVIPNKKIINDRFLYYVLTCFDMCQLVEDKSYPSVKTSDIASKIQIPVPPLPVQEEIVRILDKFTSLEAELEAELEARRVQYEYYRDELLKPQPKIPVVKLKDIATEFYRGSGIRRDEITAEGVPCVRYGEIYTTYNISFEKCVSYTKLEYVQSPKYFEYGDILFAITGENIEDIAKSVAYTGNEKCLAGGDIVVMKHNQNPRYLAHVLATTEARIQKGKGKVKSKVVHSSIPSIQEIEIPLPPLDVQERWANVLDNFDAICSDLKIGLPAEIEARKKQYEYYRDLLLTFAERGNTILTEQNRTEQMK